MMMMVEVWFFVVNSTQKSHNMHHSINRRERRKYTYICGTCIIAAMAAALCSLVLFCTSSCYAECSLRTELLEYLILSPISISFYPSHDIDGGYIALPLSI